MARRTVIIPGINGNGSGNPSIEMPIGQEYFRTNLINTSGAPSAIATFTEFQVNINGENTWPLDGIDIDEMNKFDGLGAYATDAILRLDFENQKFIDGGPRQATTINTGVPEPIDPKNPNKVRKIISSFNITWTQSGTDSWQVKAIVGDQDPVGPGAIKRFQKFQDDFLAGTEAGTTQMQYGTAKFALMRRLFLRAASGTISRVRVLKGISQAPIFDRLTAENNGILSDQGKVPGTYFGFVLDWTENNMPDHLNTLTSDYVNPETGIAIAKSLLPLITNSTSDTGIYISEFVGVVS